MKKGHMPTIHFFQELNKEMKFSGNFTEEEIKILKDNNTPLKYKNPMSHLKPKKKKRK